MIPYHIEILLSTPQIMPMIRHWLLGSLHCPDPGPGVWVVCWIFLYLSLPLIFTNVSLSSQLTVKHFQSFYTWHIPAWESLSALLCTSNSHFSNIKPCKSVICAVVLSCILSRQLLEMKIFCKFVCFHKYFCLILEHLMTYNNNNKINEYFCLCDLVVEKANSGRMSPIRKRSVKDVEQVGLQVMRYFNVIRIIFLLWVKDKNFR